MKMNRYEYLKEVSESGRLQAASTPEEAREDASFYGFNSFQGLYYDLANMELSAAGFSAPPARGSLPAALARMAHPVRLQ